MLCDGQDSVFPQHLNQGLGTPASFQRIQPSCESTALPSANGRKQESLNMRPCLRGTSRSGPWESDQDPDEENSQGRERRRQPSLFPPQWLTLSLGQQVSDRLHRWEAQVGVLLCHVKLSEPAAGLGETVQINRLKRKQVPHASELT